MIEPLVFRAPGAYPTSLIASQVAPLIRNLRGFIGAERLKHAAKNYRSEPGLQGQIRTLRLREYQPLIEAFSLFDKLTLNGARPLRRLHPGLSELASVAAMGCAVIPTLDPSTAEHQREMLVSLDGRCKPLLLEWSSATQAIRHHAAKLAWTPPGIHGGEFVALANGIEFEVECKRQTTMVSQLLGEKEADRILALIMEVSRYKKLQGELWVELTEPDNGNINDEIHDLDKILRQNLGVGDVSIELSKNAHLRGHLDFYDGHAISLDAWKQRLETARREPGHGIGNALSVGGYVMEPLLVHILSPIKSAEDFKDYLWEKKFKKAASQCSGKRGAILMFEWEGVSHPQLFVDARLFEALTKDTFDQYRHVARLVMRCEEETSRTKTGYQATTPVYSMDSKVTSFPDVLQFLKIDLPL